jgi:uncharacterized protein YjdB
MVIKITGPSAVETDTVTAAEINALPSSSASTGTDFYYSYRDGAGNMIYVIASGAPTADILSHYTSITGSDVVSATVIADGYQTNVTGDQLASAGGSNGDLDFYNGFGTTGTPVASIIATESYWDYGTSTEAPATLPTAGEMSADTALRDLYGQTSAGDMEASKSVYNIEEIDITSSVNPGSPGGVTGITLNESVGSIVYNTNDTLQLTPSFTPSGETSSVSWSCYNPGVATVSSTGLVTGVANGNAIITATTANDLTATCYVSVTNYSPNPGPTEFVSINLWYGGAVAETDTVTAAEINALPTGSESTGQDFLYSNDHSGYVYYVASGAPTADILSHYTSINASDVVSAEVYGYNSSPSNYYPASLLSAQLVGTSTDSGLDYYSSPSATGQQVASIIATGYDSSGTPFADSSYSDNYAVTSTVYQDKCMRNLYGQSAPSNNASKYWDSNLYEIDITSNVDPVPATGITLNKSVDSIVYGDTDSLTATVSPSSTATNSTVTWSSDNPAVATVNQNGVVTAVTMGTAVITATTANNLTATCDVTVTGTSSDANGPTTFMTISVNGGTTTIVTDAQVLALNPANSLSYYSSTEKNNQPWLYTSLGAPLASILAAYTNLTYSEAQDVSATFTGSDGYSPGLITNYTLCQTGYYYPSSGSPVQVYPSIGAEDYEGITTNYSQLSTSNDGLRLFYGQTGVSDGNNKHNSVYDLENIDVTYDPAPSLAATAAPGSVSGATAVTATLSISGDHLGYLVSASSIPTPNVGDTLPTGAADSYTSGSDITGVSAGMYVGVYELNVSNEVVKFDQITLTGSDINSGAASPVIQSVSAVNGTVTVTLSATPATTPAIGNFTVTQSINGATATSVTPTNIGTSGATVTLTVPQVATTTSSQSVVISVSYQGGTAVAASAFTVAAASSGGGGGGGAPLSTTATTSTTGVANVTPGAGGSVTSQNGGVTLSIPANAIQGTSTVAVDVQQASSPPATPSGFTFLGVAYDFTVGGSETYTFNSPVTLTFTFDPGKVPAGETPAVYYYDESKGRWVNLGGTVSGNTISVTVNHFTEYAVLANEAASPTASAPAFSDVSAAYWGSAAISSLSGKGIVSGYPDGTFKPGASITRAEFATMLVKALGLSTTGTIGQFTDVTADAWYYGSVNAAVYDGLVSGMGDNLFVPNALITREQMAVMVAKALGINAPATDGTELSAFSDRSAVSSWAVSGMAEAVKAGIVSGMTADTLAPNDNATRAQAAAMVYKMLSVLGK